MVDDEDVFIHPDELMLCGAEHKLIAIRIGEHRERPPIRLARLLNELHAFRLELLVRLLHVIGDEGDAGELADSILVAGWREQDDPRTSASDSELDPALRVVE